MEETLKKIQEKELNILKEITKVCDILHLKYSLYFGTMIGAIRHKGFIPWDDDIDIIMPREDYDIFLHEAQKYLPQNLFVQHYSTEKNNNNLYMKVRDTSTCFLEQNSKEFDICHGLFVDIFPFDKCKKEVARAEYRKRALFNLISICYSLENVKTIQKFYKRIIGKCIHYSYCKIIKINKHMEREEIRRKKVNSRQGDCYLLCESFYAGTINCEELFDLIRVKFENEKFCCSKHFDKILTRIYGAYMTVPSEKDRITHKPINVEI